MEILRTCFYGHLLTSNVDLASTLRYSLLYLRISLIPLFLHGMSDLLLIWWLVHTFPSVERSGVGVESQGTLLSSEVWDLLRRSSSGNPSKSRALVFSNHHRTLFTFTCPLAQLFSNSVLIHILKNWSNVAVKSICWDAAPQLNYSEQWDIWTLPEMSFEWTWLVDELIYEIERSPIDRERSGDLNVSEAEVNHNEAKPKRNGGGWVRGKW